MIKQSKNKTQPTTVENDPWIDSAAACIHLSISLPTLYRWIKTKQMKCRRTPSGELRFRRSELDSLIS